MVKIDLITGFLGSGKTTFIRKYAEYLMEQGENLGILENDYGAVNVDMMLLQDLEGEKCELEMVAGACHADCHRRRFKTKLIAMGMLGYDRVLVEPSGIFDVDEFFDVLQEEPLDRWYEIGNVISVVDATLEPDLSELAGYLLASESASAGTVIVSKIQLCNDPDQSISKVLDILNQRLEEHQCKRRFTEEDLMRKDWNAFSAADFERIRNCGYQNESFRKTILSEDSGFQTLYYLNRKDTPEEILEKIDMVFKDPAYGEVFRIKGFLQDENRNWMELNATRINRTIQPVKNGQNVLILIGENLDERNLQGLLGESGVL